MQRPPILDRGCRTRAIRTCRGLFGRPSYRSTQARSGGHPCGFLRALREGVRLTGSKPEVVSRLHQLHEWHGKAVIEVVNERLARGANVEAILSREHTSLLAVLQTPIT